MYLLQHYSINISIFIYDLSFIIYNIHEKYFVHKQSAN